MSIDGWLAIEMNRQREAKKRAEEELEAARQRNHAIAARLQELATFAETGRWVTYGRGTMSTIGDLR